MQTRLIDGSALARSIRDGLRQRVQSMASRPGLAVVLVGDDPASHIYVRNKMRACEELGVVSFDRRLAATATQDEILRLIGTLNDDPRVHAILVQLPLPKHIDANAVIAAVDPRKDADGFHPQNMGLLLSGSPRFVPCTPAGVLRLLEHAQVPIAGRHAVVVGRSKIVGKPAALLLLEKHATVTICHSRTADLASLTRQADILVAAVGRARIIGAGMVKPGAAVIDVGINRVETGAQAGKLCGDVDFHALQGIAGWLTPVPGGVGPMTIAMLLENTVRAAERQAA